jgi:hypothetical protein
MPYLVCDKCGSYYELQEGESPEDFDLKCACGGELIYSKKLRGIEDSNEPETTITCPQCGTENVNNIGYCQECGAKLPRNDKSPKSVFSIILDIIYKNFQDFRIRWIILALNLVLMFVIMIIKMTT